MSIFHRWIKHTFRNNKPLRQIPKRKTRLNLEPLEDRVTPSASPYLVSIDLANPAQATTNSSSVSWTVTFNEAVTGVNPTDFSVVKTGTVGDTLVQVAPVSGSGGEVYTATVSGITGNGSLGLNLHNNGTIVSAVGANPLDPLTLAGPVTYAIGASYAQEGVATADLRGDGISDIIIPGTYHQDGLVGVLLGNGDGTFQGEVYYYAGTGGPTQGVAAGDLNGDGKVDIVAVGSNYTADVLMGNGDGTFQGPVQYYTGGNTYGVALGDLNGDGRLDIVVSNKGGRGPNAYDVGVFMQNPDGTFQSMVVYNTGVNSDAISLAALKPGGPLDIVVEGFNNGAVSVLMGNGDGTFQAATPISTAIGGNGGANSYGGTVAVLTGDGIPDIVALNQGGNNPTPGNLYANNGASNNQPANVTILMGNGDGTFQAPVSYALDGPYATTVSVADMNGDGTPDIVVGYGPNYGTHNYNVAVLLGNGNGTFQAPQTFSAIALGTYSGGGASGGPWAAVGQVNGDGVPFIGTMNRDYSSSVLLDTSVGFNGSPVGQVATIDTIAPYVEHINTIPSGGQTVSASSVSFDVLFSEPVTGVAPVDFQPTGTAAAGTTVSSVSAVSQSEYTVTVSGITLTGTVGLNLVDDTPAENTIRDLAGNALTQPDHPLSFAGQQTFSNGSGYSVATPVVSDLRGDGINDVVVSNFGTRTVNVMLGNGNGTFQAPVSYGLGGGDDKPVGILAADVNGDGFPDLVVTNYRYGTVDVLLNNGNGTFQTAKPFSSGGNYSVSVTVGDVNGDGNADIIVVNKFSKDVGVLLGNGDGTFQTVVTYATGYSPRHVTLADLNGDGKPDIIVANEGYYISPTGFNDHTVSILYGNGDGTFQGQQTFAVGPTGSAPYGVTVADLNGDQKPDIVVANYNNGSVGVLLNTGLDGSGHATFQTVQTYATGYGSTVAVSVADVNGDGIPDIVAGNLGGNVSVFLGNGDGTFQGAHTLVTGGNWGGPVVDVNSDGRPDIVAGPGTYGAEFINSANGDYTGTQFYQDNLSTPTTTVVTTDQMGPYSPSSSLTFLATISGTPSVGSVTFYEGPGLTNQIGSPLAVSSGTADTSATPVNLAAGTYTITAVYSGGTGFTGSTGTDVITVSNPPSITSVVINEDRPALYDAAGQGSGGFGTQRSMVDDVVYTFSEGVNIASPSSISNVFTIAYAPGFSGTSALPTLSWAPVAGTSDTEWAVTFSGSSVEANSIADGVYAITVNDPAAITAQLDSQQLALAGSGIGSATQTFYRLYGDINGDHVVNNADNKQFVNALNTYNAAFDFNGDGVVNNADNKAFVVSLNLNYTGFTTTI